MRNKFYGELIKLKGEHTHTCNKPCKDNDGWTIRKWTCGKPAVYATKNGLYYFCRHHSLMGRFVVRNGDVGEILARFDTEEELRNNIHLFPGMEMQKLSKSHRGLII